MSSEVTIRPHIRYFWEGRRFSPQRIAPTEHGAWVTEGPLPLIAHVDLRTGATTGPFDLGRPDNGASEAINIVVENDTVWLRTSDRVRWFDPATRTSGDIAAKGMHLAAGGGAIWTVASGSCIARIESDRSGIEPLASLRPYRMIAAHGHLWAAEWRDGTTTFLWRINPTDGTRGPAIELPGTPQWLASDDEAVWVYLWRQVGRHMTGALVRVDPAAVVATDELPLAAAGSPCGVVHGELWVQSTSVRT